MPSHLRNGKDLSFEQQEAAKRESKKAAKRAQQRLQRATDRVDLGRLSELVSSSDLGTTKLHNPSSHRSAAGGYLPVGYTFSLAALERLRRAQEQQIWISSSYPQDLRIDPAEKHSQETSAALEPNRPTS
ncbi:hypothetical protein PCASD_26015, partial [Puccinia coronata f. sp. avenae]